MVRSFLIFFICFKAHADFLGFKTGDSKSRIPALVEKLKALPMNDGPSYEDGFNQMVKLIEITIDEEKLICLGESADSAGKVVPKEQKQLCFRELKANYLEAVETIFNLKKKYLGVIHNRQLEKMNDIQSRLKSDIEKSF
jgi:hypothetical protein